MNLDQSSYEWFVGSDPKKPHWNIFGENAYMFGHKVTLHFLINDIFMCFFFGLAAKEVTEACLPGGSLNPPRKALSPLIGTLGGVFVPVGLYLVLCTVFYNVGLFDDYTTAPPIATGGSGAHRLLEEAGNASAASGELGPLKLSELTIGWGVPTATDISIAWMVAVQVFPLRHPAIEFLLLLQN